MMISILAYRLQEQAFGPLSPSTRSRLLKLADAFETDPNSRTPVTPAIKPGTRLIRQWGDRVHLVNVEAKGYEYQGARYRSLSQIARLITGVRWSGPLFFGTKSHSTSKSKRAEI
jgi:hypothetical protein